MATKDQSAASRRPAAKAKAAAKPRKPAAPAMTRAAQESGTARPAAVPGDIPPPEAVAAAAAADSSASAPRQQARLSQKDLDDFRRDLLAMRERLTGKVARLHQSSLKRDDEVNPEEDGTDAFDRLFALERAGGDQKVIRKIDEALRAIAEGTYGVCEECHELIQMPRLRALPFAKNCIRCQAEQERRRGGRAAPRRVAP